jgi:hypothetical protein
MARVHLPIDFSKAPLLSRGLMAPAWPRFGSIAQYLSFSSDPRDPIPWTPCCSCPVVPDLGPVLVTASVRSLSSVHRSPDPQMPSFAIRMCFVFLLCKLGSSPGSNLELKYCKQINESLFGGGALESRCSSGTSGQL